MIGQTVFLPAVSLAGASASPTPAVALALVSILALIYAAFLSAGETALSRLSRATAQDLIEDGVRHAHLIDYLLQHRERTMLSLRAVRTFLQVIIAVGATLALGNLPLPWWAVALIAVFAAGFFQYIAVSVIGVRVARRRPEAVARWIAPSAMRMVRSSRWVDPLIARLRGRLPQPSQTEAEARAEVANDLREMVDQVGETEGLEAEDRQMLRSVFELGHTLVREIMTPRIDIVDIDAQTCAQDALSLFVSSGFSRLPVVGEDVDDVRGILYLKDVIRRIDDQGVDVELTAEQMMRPAEYTVEMKPADDLLRHLQARHCHMAMVVDEYGGISGLVTLEDLLEELVGDLTDEHDRVVMEPEEINNGVWRVPARFPKDDLGDLLGVELEDDDVDSVGGLLAKAIDRVPEPGDSGEILGLSLTAEADPGRRSEVGTIIAERIVLDDETDVTE